MSISVGGINLVESIINLDYELARTQRILEWIVNNNKIIAPPPDQIKKIDDESMRAILQKYPSAGITQKGSPGF